MQKERIYLTDITLHVRDFRQTVNFSKIAEKSRLYSKYAPAPVADNKSSDNSNNPNVRRFAINFPSDLMERVNKGEVELMMPKDGLMMYAGRDAWEKIAEMKEAERRQLIHRNRFNTWHADDKGV